MADYNINAVTRRVVYSGSAGLGPYSFSFEVLDQDDLAVYFNTTKLTLTTDYTVTINANGTGSITIVTGTNVPSTPTGSDTIIIVGARDIERVTDFVTAGDLRASALNEQLDGLTIFDQQIAEEQKRTLQAPVYDPAHVDDGGTLDMTLPAKSARAGKYLQFNSTTGNPEAGPDSTDVTTLADVATDIALLADIQDGTTATNAITTVSGISANVTTVAGIASNVSTVAGISADVTSVAADTTDIGTVATNIASVNTVAGIDSNVTTVAGISSDVTAVAADATDIGAVAAKATEIGRLGTADAVSDLNTLGTADVVSDMNTLGTAANVTNMNTLAGISANITTVAGISANVTTVAGDSADIQAVAADAADIGTVASNISDVNTAAANITDIQNASTNAATATTKAAEAATSATNAATSETNAATSASAAAASQVAAAASAASAASAFDNFDDTYLGSKTSDPTVDNDGDPLTQGDLYFNSTANEMRVYDGANWIAATSAGGVSLILYEYTATSGQTTFSGADDNAATLSYTADNIQVFMNGVNLDPSDYTATNGTSVVLASGAAVNDVLNIYAFKSFTVADTVSASAGGTFSANVAVTGDLTVDTNTLYVDSTNNRVGIGTSSPSQPVEIAKDAGQGTTPPTLRITNTKADYGSSATTNVPHGAIEFYMSEGSGNYPAVGAAIKAINESIYAENHGLAFFTNSDTSTPTERLRILSSGGITFNGDTAAANALDDYEEGTWTPVLRAVTTDPTYTLSNSTGHYVKIGDMVYFGFYSSGINISSSGVGSATVDGLPYTSANGTEEYWLFNYKHGTALNTTTCSGGYIAKNSTYMVFILDGSISGPSWATGNPLYLMVSGAYRTTA